tara:strand:- start:4482 stop:5951 length:1470 start_codon:yes stop_codon:yes gene_type:complete
MANSSTFHNYFSSLEAFKNHRLCSEIVQRYDIRGIFNQNLTVQDAYVLGHTLTVYFQKQPSVAKPVFIIGHDCRPSYPQLKQALITGITEVGGSVIDVGLAPTPLVNVCTLKKDIFDLPGTVVASIVITASHNPAPYNGFKIMDAFGMPLCGDDLAHLLLHNIKPEAIQQIHERALDGAYLQEQYLTFLLDHFKGLSLHPSKTYIWDTGNGVCGPLVTKLISHLPGEHHMINVQPDASFPDHTPDPSVEKNMTSLKQAILEKKADLGFGIDMDGDRLGIIDSAGNYWNGDKLSYLFAENICQKKSSKIIVDVKSSQTILDHVKELGSQAILCPTGHALIKQQLKKDPKIAFAGEYSGHHYFPHDYCQVDDALFSALTALTIDQNMPFAERWQTLPKVYSIAQRTVTYPTHAEKNAAMEDIKIKVKSLNLDTITIDGIRLSFPNGWGLIRASNTEPALTYRAEAETEQALSEIITLIEQQLLKTDSCETP